MAAQGSRGRMTHLLCLFFFVCVLLLLVSVILGFYRLSCCACRLHDESQSLQLRHTQTQVSGVYDGKVGMKSLIHTSTKSQSIQLVDTSRSILRRGISGSTVSLIPGSKPPPCHGQCPGCYSGVCVARPLFLRGSGGAAQHAVWNCLCL
ncbi:hypothetical protein KP509_07G085300 [Ceratopteris richardii]|uniref:Uncharacterized protein n=1 Tax=Ceratopteris richardii TaxID=49495 RepID=A0A8T2UCT7_CERRI|nr:hypothetical protein KP509_07G085300 [Ceratopteris richardii]